MLRNAGVKCLAIPADLDEVAFRRNFVGAPAALALELAAAKAAMIASAYPDALVIGADQILLCGNEIFSKPETPAKAAIQLNTLSGRTHELITALCVHRGPARLWSDIATARMTMRPLSAPFIAQYLAAEGQAVCGSVGAYRLEGLGSQLFSAIEGDFFTILGLNLLPLLGFLRAEAMLPA